MSSTSSPDLLPLLSRGKHRSPRKGACFMEFASYWPASGGATTPRARIPCSRRWRGT